MPSGHVLSDNGRSEFNLQVASDKQGKLKLEL